MRKPKVKLITFSLYSLFLLCFFGGYSLSWFDDSITIPKNYDGQSAGAYFAGGDGSGDNPYLITNKRHFYNLTWLQYLGYFNKDIRKADETADNSIDTVYFSLNNNLDLEGLALPPLGSEKYPFVGYFSGNNHTIKNYTVTDNYSSLRSHPSLIDEEGNDYYKKGTKSIKYCSIIGTFGIIGPYDFNSYRRAIDKDGKESTEATFYSDVKKANKVENLYFDRFTISSSADKVLIGLLAGYVDGQVSNCGVHYGSLNISSDSSNLDGFNKLSSFSLIGEYNKTEYNWEDDPTSGKGDEGYGTSTDIVDLYDKLKKLNITPESGLAESVAIPFKFDEQKSFTPQSSERKDVQSSGTTISKVSYSSTIEVDPTKRNIGYYVGDQIKIYKNKFTNKNIDYSNIISARNSPVDPNDTSNPEFVKHIQGIKDYLNTIKEDGSKAGDSAIRFTGSRFDAADTSTLPFPTNPGSYTLIKGKIGPRADGTFYEGDIFVPNRGIWVAPVKPGRFEFVGISEEDFYPFTLNAFSIFKLQRNIPGDYSSGFANTTYYEEMSFDKTPGKEDDPNDHDLVPGAIKGSKYTPNYYGVNVTSDDIKKGVEFFITKREDTNKNPFIIYIDIGSDGGDDSDTRTSLSGFDFVEEDNKKEIVKIKNYDSANGSYTDNDKYTKSKVVFPLEGTSNEDVFFYFKRVQEAGVLYFVSPSNSGVTITGISGTGGVSFGLAKDKSCNGKA